MSKFAMTAIISALALMAGIISIFYLGADNPVEQVSEAIILKETGFQIDISPNIGNEGVKASPH
jgi:hypothetical protein